MKFSFYLKNVVIHPGKPAAFRRTAYAKKLDLSLYTSQLMFWRLYGVTIPRKPSLYAKQLTQELLANPI